MKRENKLIYGLAGVAIILLAIVCFWSSPKRTYTGKLVSEDGSVISQEIPHLELSREEMDLYEQLRQNPEILEMIKECSIEENREGVVLEDKLLQKLAGTILPEEADNVGMQIEALTVILSYSLLNVDIKICYPMTESEEIIKIISVFGKDTDAMCRFQYVNYGNQKYEKYKTVRVWFPWQISR